MDESSQEKPIVKQVDRRNFLKSLFGGLGGGAVVEPHVAKAASPKPRGVSFFWTNLRNGQVGFPTGTNVPSGKPGSVMKIVSAAALRQAGLYSEDQTIECRGSVHINNETYSCLYPHGKVDLIRAIGLSCNVFFATASQQISPRAIIASARNFGLNSPIEGHGAEIFPNDDKLQADCAHYALGLAPDLRPNALQLLRIPAAVALRGNVPKMHNTGFSSEDDRSPFHVKLEPHTWTALQQGMRMCDREGTAKHLDPTDKLKMATKTGTVPHGTTFESWLIGYFPYETPTYAFCLRAPSGTSQERAVPEAHKWLFATEWS